MISGFGDSNDSDRVVSLPVGVESADVFAECFVFEVAVCREAASARSVSQDRRLHLVGSFSDTVGNCVCNVGQILRNKLAAGQVDTFMPH